MLRHRHLRQDLRDSQRPAGVRVNNGQRRGDVRIVNRQRVAGAAGENAQRREQRAFRISQRTFWGLGPGARFTSRRGLPVTP